MTTQISGTQALRNVLAEMGCSYGDKYDYLVSYDGSSDIRPMKYDRIIADLTELAYIIIGTTANLEFNPKDEGVEENWKAIIAETGYTIERFIYVKDLRDNLNNWPANPLDNIEHRKGFADAMEVLIDQYQLECGVLCGPSCSMWHDCGYCIDPELVTETHTWEMVQAEFEEEICLQLNTVKDDYYYSFTKDNYYLPTDATAAEKHNLMRYKKKAAGVENIDAEELLERIAVMYGSEYITDEYKSALYSMVITINNSFGMPDFPMAEFELCVLLTSDTLTQQEQIAIMEAYHKKYVQSMF